MAGVPLLEGSWAVEFSVEVWLVNMGKFHTMKGEGPEFMDESCLPVRNKHFV